MKLQVTDTQLELAINKSKELYGDKISYQKIRDIVHEDYDVDITRQAIQERIRKSVKLHDLYFGVKNTSHDNPILIKESQKMFRGLILPDKMDVLTIGNIKPERIRGKIVYGYVPMEMLHLPKHIVIGEANKLYVLGVSRMLQHGDR